MQGLHTGTCCVGWTRPSPSAWLAGFQWPCYKVVQSGPEGLKWTSGLPHRNSCNRLAASRGLARGGYPHSSLQLTGTQKASQQLWDMQLVPWQGLGTQLARLQEAAQLWAAGQHGDKQLQEVAELHTGRESRATQGAQQELLQPGDGQ